MQKTNKLNLTVMRGMFFFLVGISSILLVFALVVTTKISGSAECEIDGIKLVNVSPNDCYSNFAPEFCPIPENIKCSFKGDVPVFLIGR
jgi:hypothetical protein